MEAGPRVAAQIERLVDAPGHLVGLEVAVHIVNSEDADLTAYMTPEHKYK